MVERERERSKAMEERRPPAMVFFFLIDGHASFSFCAFLFFFFSPLSLSSPPSLLAFHPSPSQHYSQVFISDIRAATNKEAEQTRVEKELAKIRKKFATGTAVTGELMVSFFCYFTQRLSFRSPVFQPFLLL